MTFRQAIISLSAKPRGFHLITREVLDKGPGLGDFEVGFLQLFLQHTSASLLINENADPDVRGDMERWANHVMPENAPYYEHTLEGPDDMPAHLKAVVFGPSLLIPVRDGALALGTWQGIYLGEHRDHGGPRNVVATVYGQLKSK
ncbi:MAG: secondary thiamine-phosphate synthase enzyme YjbQ [Deltaproteobacteria bacterium]|nr:secondary thiamine-phosphate synthase enzyme YjbQ [Deltaproteobacteria bacterium]